MRDNERTTESRRRGGEEVENKHIAPSASRDIHGPKAAEAGHKLKEAEW